MLRQMKHKHVGDMFDMAEMFVAPEGQIVHEMLYSAGLSNFTVKMLCRSGFGHRTYPIASSNRIRCMSSIAKATQEQTLNLQCMVFSEREHILFAGLNVALNSSS